MTMGIALSGSHALHRLAAIVLVFAIALPVTNAQAQRHGGWSGGGWHGGGGWGWHGGGWGGGWGWGWGPGVAFGFGLPPIYYAPPPAYYYPPPYYPGPAYYPSPPGYYPPQPYPYGYAPGYYGSGGPAGAYNAYPGYGVPVRRDPNNCGTPDEPKPCTR